MQITAIRRTAVGVLAAATLFLAGCSSSDGAQQAPAGTAVLGEAGAEGGLTGTESAPASPVSETESVPRVTANFPTAVATTTSADDGAAGPAPSIDQNTTEAVPASSASQPTTEPATTTTKTTAPKTTAPETTPVTTTTPVKTTEETTSQAQVTNGVDCPACGEGPTFGDTETQDNADFAGLVTSVGFTTPSGNINCGFTDAAVVCQIQDKTYQVPTTEVCDGAGADGGTVEVDGSGAHFLCAGGLEGGGPTLEYGQSLVVGDFGCASRETGVQCVNLTTGSAFILSKASYQFA